MIRDRGRIKWTSMMLPEHVKMLRDWTEEDSHEAAKILDDQQLEEMNVIMGEAMEADKIIMITYYERNKYQLLIGTIHHYNELENKLHVIDRFQDVHYLKMPQIIDVRFLVE